jgi:hypothetical protein
MKNIAITVIFILFVVLTGCTREPAIEPSADFTTNLVNNTTLVKTDFVMYTDKIKGEWATYFRGNDSAHTYRPDFYRALGVNLDLLLDSVVMGGYSNAGSYQLTVVASSSGNWNKDYLQDVKTITITVTE